MKKLVKKPVTVEKVVEKITQMEESIEDQPGGLETLLGKRVFIMCSYFYTGVLTGVNGVDVELSEPELVYETGSWAKKSFASSEKLPTDKLNIRTASIESYFEMK
jgi:hypothetical protein